MQERIELAIDERSDPRWRLNDAKNAQVLPHGRQCHDYRGTSEEDKAKLFFGTAAKVYKIGEEAKM